MRDREPGKAGHAACFSEGHDDFNGTHFSECLSAGFGGAITLLSRASGSSVAAAASMSGMREFT